MNERIKMSLWLFNTNKDFLICFHFLDSLKNQLENNLLYYLTQNFQDLIPYKYYYV